MVYFCPLRRFSIKKFIISSKDLNFDSYIVFVKVHLWTHNNNKNNDGKEEKTIWNLRKSCSNQRLIHGNYEAFRLISL